MLRYRSDPAHIISSMYSPSPRSRAPCAPGELLPSLALRLDCWEHPAFCKSSGQKGGPPSKGRSIAVPPFFIRFLSQIINTAGRLLFQKQSRNLYLFVSSRKPDRSHHPSEARTEWDPYASPSLPIIYHAA